MNRLTLLSCAALLTTAPFVLAEDRSTTVMNEITAWNDGLSAEDRQAKYCKMNDSAYVFYRGTNHLFWKDFAGDARLEEFGDDKTRAWIQGDLHAYNFGAFDNDDETVVYELNDFDEAMRADYQYDVWRMATSLVLIARENGGFNQNEQEDIVDAFSEAYLDAMADYRGNDDEIGLTFTAQNTYGKLDDFLENTENDNSRREMLDKWTNEVNGARQFDTALEKLSAVDATTRNAIIAAMPTYGNTLLGGLHYDADYFEVKDVARRLLAGTGSLGTPRFYVLIEGETTSQHDDRILDVKQQSRPTPYWYLGATTQLDYNTAFANDGQRHALAYLALTNHSDDHVGWMTLSDGVYSVRERSPFKESFPAETLDSNTRFLKLAEQWGTILATAHARSDKDFMPDCIAHSVDKQIDEQTDGHHSEFRALVRSIALPYADQVEADWQVFAGQTSCP